MSETTDKATLLKQTIDWLVATRLLVTIEERRAILISARFDDQLLGQIEFEGSAAVFSSRLLNLLLNYEPLATGKRWLTSLLKTVGASLGIDHQATMEGLIAGVNAYVPSPDQTAVGDNQEHITSAERPSLWIGVPDLPRYGLVGRDELVTDLVNQLSTDTAVSLSLEGKPGSGKTALAVALAHRRDLLAHFSDGVLWASLGPKGEPFTALVRWATAVGLDPTAYGEPHNLKQAIRDAIGQKALLLVIDDIWRQEDADLLRCGGPFCAHILTTRDLIIAHNFAKGLAVVRIPELQADPAFALLQTIAPKACEANPALARDLTLAVGGLPLAIELLGGYLVQSAGAIRGPFRSSTIKRLKELQDPAQRLQLAQVRLGSVAKETELQEVIVLSLDGAPEEVQHVFYALGAFAPKPANFSLQAALAVAQTDEEPLEWLVQRNLLDVVSLPDIAEEQLTLHQVLADVARARTPAAAQLLHGDYYLDLVSEDRKDWHKIDTAYAQIRWAWDQWPDDMILPWVWFLHEYQYTRGLWHDLLAWHQRALPIARAAGQRTQEARLLNTLGWVQAALGQQENALANLELALRIREEEGDRAGVATTLTDIGVVYQRLNCLDEALEYYQRALPISEEMSDLARMSRVLNNIGTIYMALNQPGEALNYLQRALSIREELNWRHGVATTLSNIGSIYMALGRKDEAFDCFRRALAITEELGSRAGEISVRQWLARLQYNDGNLPEAIAHLHRAYNLAAAVSSPDLPLIENTLVQYEADLASQES